MTVRVAARRGFQLFLLLIGLWALLLSVGALRLYLSLSSARTSVSHLRADVAAGDLGKAQRDAGQFGESVRAAEHRVHSPIWVATIHVPILGRQLAAVSSLTDIASDISQSVLEPARPVLARIQTRPTFSKSAVDLETIDQLANVADAASSSLLRTEGRQRQISDSSWLLPPIRGLNERMARQVQTASLDVKSLAQALHVLPAMLGANGTRRYFVAVQNPAEARGTGGLITGYSIVLAEHGHIRVTATGTNLTFSRFTGAKGFAAQGFQEGYQALAAGGARRAGVLHTWLGANIVPDWPNTASTISTLWKQQNGQVLDGVIGIDPVVMAAALHVSGPVQLSDGTQVSANNAIQYMQVRQYASYAGRNQARKRLNNELAGLALNGFLHSQPSLRDGVAMLRRSTRAGDLLVASTHPEEERLLRDSSVGGVMPTRGPMVQITTQNIAGGKMDAFVTRRTTVSAAPASTGRRRDVVTVVLTGLLGKTDALTPTQTARLDDPKTKDTRGTTRELVTVYAGPGGVLQRVDPISGATAAGSGRDLAHPYLSFDVLLLPQRSVTISVIVDQPDGRLLLRTQPLARPERVLLNARAKRVI